MKALHKAFNELAKFNQFVVSKNKVPLNPSTLRKIDPYNSYNWMSASQAIKHAEILGAGVGFVLTDSDPFFFVDIDHCLNEKWSELSIDICNQFPGAAIELSQSKRGLHIIGKADKINHSCKNTKLDIELYTENRIVLLTGINTCGDSGKRFDISMLVDKYFKPKHTQELGWTTEPVSEWTGYEDDNELIKHALHSNSSFKDLWECNEDVLAESYPDNHGNRTYDESSADAALIQHLSFWTGKNCERIANLLWQSQLVREKWEIHGYLRRSIMNGVSLDGDVYTKKKF